MSRAVSAPPTSSQSETATRAPSRANIVAMARPMPEAAPVTNAEFPSNLPGMAPALRREPHRHVLDPSDEVRAEALWLAHKLDVRQPPDDLLEHHLDLKSRQVGAQAEVGAARPKGDVRVRIAGDVEHIAVGEVVLVAVRRAVIDAHLVALRDL